jgi:hypothetical protein
MGPKIDVMERERKNFNFWSASKQCLVQKVGNDVHLGSEPSSYDTVTQTMIQDRQKILKAKEIQYT